MYRIALPVFIFLLAPVTPASANPRNNLHKFRLGEHSFDANVLSFTNTDTVALPEGAPEFNPPLSFDATKWNGKPGVRRALVVRTFDARKKLLDTGYSECSGTDGGNLGTGMLRSDWDPKGAEERYFSVQEYDCSATVQVLSGDTDIGAETLAGALRSPDTRAVGLVLERLKREHATTLPSPVIADALYDHYRHGDDTTRFAALSALAAMRDARAIPHLIERLNDARALRETLSLLQAYGPEANAAAPKLRKLLQSTPAVVSDGGDDVVRSQREQIRLEIALTLDKIDPGKPK